jgi:hypothetical protein
VTLAFTLLRDRSILDDEFERLRLEVWLVVTLALIELSELSRLELELDRLRLDA